MTPAASTRAQTGADGRFQLEVEPGEYRVSAFDPERGSTHSMVSVGAGGAGDVRLSLARGASISGTVVDTAGRPLPGVSVMAGFDDGTSRSGSYSGSLPDGTFVVRGLATDKVFTVSAWTENGRFAVRNAVRAGAKDVVLAMRPGGRVRVLVRGADGAPVEGAFASVPKLAGNAVGGTSLRTDGQGVVELVAPAGTVEVRANKDALSGKTTAAVTAGGVVSAEITLAQEKPKEQK